MNQLFNKFIFFLIPIILFSSCINEIIEESCSCKITWNDKLKNSTLSNDGENFKNSSSLKYYKNNKYELWNNIEVDHFLDFIGGRKIIGLNNFKAYELEVGNDILWIYEDNTAWSTDYTMRFQWKFKDNKLLFFKSENISQFNLFQIVIESGKPVFIESEENKAERGVSEKKLPAKVLDLCNCKCDLIDNGYSDIFADDSCLKLVNSRSYLLNIPWGDKKTILENF